MLWWPVIFTSSIVYIVHCINYYLPRALGRRNYIANNLQNSHVEMHFCALRNTPVDLLKVPFKRSTYIYIRAKSKISASCYNYVNIMNINIDVKFLLLLLIII